MSHMCRKGGTRAILWKNAQKKNSALWQDSLLEAVGRVYGPRQHSACHRGNTKDSGEVPSLRAFL